MSEFLKNGEYWKILSLLGGFFKSKNQKFCFQIIFSPEIM